MTHKRIVAAWAPRRYPSVDVFLPVCGEPIEVLRNAWSHVAAVYDHSTGTRRLYANGVKIAEHTDAPITVLNANTMASATWAMNPAIQILVR